jgi:hypothetical protein
MRIGMMAPVFLRQQRQRHAAAAQSCDRETLPKSTKKSIDSDHDSYREYRSLAGAALRRPKASRGGNRDWGTVAAPRALWGFEGSTWGFGGRIA